MNYCTKCQSLYEKPGTCNCFAGTQPAIVPTLPLTPTIPTWQPSPIWIAPYWCGLQDGHAWTDTKVTYTGGPTTNAIGSSGRFV